jgi:hypothetical protein
MNRTTESLNSAEEYLTTNLPGAAVRRVNLMHRPGSAGETQDWAFGIDLRGGDLATLRLSSDLLEDDGADMARRLERHAVAERILGGERNLYVKSSGVEQWVP